MSDSNTIENESKEETMPTPTVEERFPPITSWDELSLNEDLLRGIYR